MLRKIFLLLLPVALLACNFTSSTDKAHTDAATIQNNTWEPPAAGTEVARYEERVKEDKLNEKYFRAVVTTTPESRKGKFSLRLEYGFNINETTIELPAWTGSAVLKPVLQKAEGDYHCLLGFDTGDGQFHELYDIRAEAGNVRLKQTKGYYPTR